MTEFPLKITAMATMLCDHIAYFLMAQGAIGEPLYTIMRSVGRCAFIIYAFLMVEACRHLVQRPERLKSQYGKLAAILLASEIPYDYFREGVVFDPTSQNVMFTLSIGFIMLAAFEKTRHERCLWVFIAAIAASASFLACSDYRFTGILLMLGFYWYLENYSTAPIPQRIIVLLVIMVAYILIYTWTSTNFGPPDAFVEKFIRRLPWYAVHILMIIPLAFYNGKVGYRSPVFNIVYSWFYPAHLCVIALVRVGLGV